jgi:NAD+ synthase (glutamine-hydrolysing)
LYSNQIGCDGERVYYDGCSLICQNGQVVARGSQFSLDQVQVITATVDLEQVRSYQRSVSSRCMQATTEKDVYPRITFDLDVCSVNYKDLKNVCKPIPLVFHTPEEEIR